MSERLRIAHMPSWNIVVDILKVGISGFSLLLAFFAYKLLSDMQGKPPRANSAAKNARLYMVFSLAMVVLIGAFSVVDKFLLRDDASERFGKCAQSLLELETNLDMGGATVENLRNQIRAHINSCGSMKGL